MLKNTIVEGQTHFDDLRCVIALYSHQFKFFTFQDDIFVFWMTMNHLRIFWFDRDFLRLNLLIPKTYHDELIFS